MTAEQRLYYADALATGQTFAVHLANRLTGGLVGAELQGGTFCHYLLTRFCIFCEDVPRRPEGYPAVDGHNVRIKLP